MHTHICTIAVFLRSQVRHLTKPLQKAKSCTLTLHSEKDLKLKVKILTNSQLQSSEEEEEGGEGLVYTESEGAICML